MAVTSVDIGTLITRDPNNAPHPRPAQCSRNGNPLLTAVHRDIHVGMLKYVWGSLSPQQSIQTARQTMPKGVLSASPSVNTIPKH